MILDKRVVLFLVGCIGTRLLMAYIPQTLPKNALPIMGIAIAIMGLGFLYLWITNSRLNAQEAGGKTWWAHLRLVHASLYIAAAIYLFKGDRSASIPLVIDVISGILFYFIKRVKILN